MLPWYPDLLVRGEKFLRQTQKPYPNRRTQWRHATSAARILMYPRLGSPRPQNAHLAVMQNLPPSLAYNPSGFAENYSVKSKSSNPSLKKGETRENL
ncbi:hypothetical protein ACJRO7_016986 [Eucalyptus globulus]|uniref:Uncharacterized protein n=1 Tax=Eucalyptus globulus TaxID=34317 RepID=A0ABD3KVS3_EUCGL